ncbi:MAG: hypothetical protein AB7Q97_01960 [Gammaproteobacteria bacterium]
MNTSIFSILDPIGTLIDLRADQAITEIREMAISARRSIGQRVRFAQERLRDKSDRPKPTEAAA